MKVRARLSLCERGKTVQTFPIPDEGTGIGREADNFIQLTDPKVSKHHAEIRPEGEEWVIRDTGSRNGITVNGLQVHSTQLHNGDRIVIGPFLLVFETSVDGDWKPSHVIDFSTQVGRQTMPQKD